MPISVKWLIPNLVTYSFLEGDMTQELRVYDETMLKLLNSSNQPLVHAISDISHVTAFASLPESMGLKCLRHPNAGWIVTIGAIHNPVLRMLTSMTLSVVKLRFREAQTMEEACRILQERVPGLPDVQQAWDVLGETMTS